MSASATGGSRAEANASQITIGDVHHGGQHSSSPSRSQLEGESGTDGEEDKDEDGEKDADEEDKKEDKGEEV